MATKSQSPIFLLILVILIGAGIGAYVLIGDNKCPETDSLITEECQCGDTKKCEPGKVCKTSIVNGKSVFECSEREPPPVSSQESKQEEPDEKECGDVECGENGECYQGKCLCKSGWSGPTCSKSNMDWDKISNEDGGIRVNNINGVNYCANNYYKEINDDGGDCILCPKSSISDDKNIRSKSPNTDSIDDCRCENINGYNLNYIDFENKTCTMCPQDENSTTDNPSKIVTSSTLVGSEKDCICNNNGGWYKKSDSDECFKCPIHSEYNVIQEKCECIPGYENASGSDECILTEEGKRNINKCGIYKYEKDSDGSIKLVDNKPQINGTVVDLNNSDIYDSNTSNKPMNWSKNHTNQFMFTDEGICQYNSKDSKAVNCGEAGSVASNFDENCNKCKEGSELIWDEINGFQCISDMCKSNIPDISNIENCFIDTNIIPTQDEKFMRETDKPGNYICKKSDENNPLSKNICDTSILNIGGGDTNGDASKLPGTDTIRIPDWNTGNSNLNKSQYASDRYNIDENSGKILCSMNENVRGNDSEDNNEKRCLQKNNICERFNKNELGEFQEKICKNTSKCVDIDVPPYYDCVDPNKQEPLTSTTADSENEYFKDGNYNKCPSFVIRNGIKTLITDEEASNSNELVIKGYGKLCHLSSAVSNSKIGDGICGWGYMSDNGASELKKYNDPIGGADISDNGAIPKQTMSNYFNLPITKNNEGTLQYDKYNCDCENANGIGKHYRDYKMSLDESTFCFAPTPTADTVTALQATDDSSSGSVQLPWQYMYQAIVDRDGNSIPIGNDDTNLNIWKEAIMNNTRIPCINNTDTDLCSGDDSKYPTDGNSPFPNSINNISTYLDCSKLNTDTLSTADGYETGHFYYFDKFGTDSGTGFPPQCLLCSDRSSNLEGHNQIDKSWFGWNSDNVEDPKDYNEWKQKWKTVMDLNKSSDLIMKAKINIGEPSSTGYQNKICGKAYPGYAGTIYEGTTIKEGTANSSIGGEKVSGDGPNRPVQTESDGTSFIKRKADLITDAETLNGGPCVVPEDQTGVSMNWSPGKFWFSTDDNNKDSIGLCNIWDEDGQIKSSLKEDSNIPYRGGTGSNPAESDPGISQRDWWAFHMKSDDCDIQISDHGTSICNMYNIVNETSINPSIFTKGPHHQWNCAAYQAGENSEQWGYCKMPNNTWGV